MVKSLVGGSLIEPPYFNADLQEVFLMKCLWHYEWVKMPRNIVPEGKGVLNAKVNAITPGSVGILVTLSGCEAQRFSDFAGMLAGHC